MTAPIQSVDTEAAAPTGLWGIAACAETARRIGRARWEMLRLVYEHGLTQREVAQNLHLRESVVRRDIARGLRVMAAVISGEEAGL